MAGCQGGYTAEDGSDGRVCLVGFVQLGLNGRVHVHDST